MTDSPPSGHQRRFSRIPFDAAVRIIADDLELHGELADLSLKGALVKLQAGHGLRPGAAAQLHIRLTDEVGIDMQATVAHVEETGAGLRCDFIDVESITHLARIVELNTGDPDLLHRELTSLVANPDDTRR